MAKYSIEDTTLADIADAIRAKEESSAAIPVADFATRISDIQTGVDTSADTVVADALTEGYTAHDAAGNVVNGTNPYAKATTDSTVNTQADLIAQIMSVLVTPIPVAYTTATSGVTYTDGIANLNATTVSRFGKAISNNSEITNETTDVYIDYGDTHYKVSIGNQVTLALDGTDYVFDIIGFNHDTLTDSNAYGEATATGKAGITLQMHDLFATSYAMNSSKTNSGGWKSSAMRTSTMATMKGYLPDDWEAIIKPVNKASGTGGGSSSGTETVSDSCFLLAEIEIFGSTTYSVSGEGSQYAYYKAGNSKVKNRSGSASNWWERSPRSGGSIFFCFVNTGGGASSVGANSVFGAAFGFCI